MFNLTDAQKEKISEEIEAFFLDVLDEEISELRKDQLVDLFCESLAPIVYNRALDDAKAWVEGQIDNLACDYTMLYRNVD